MSVRPFAKYKGIELEQRRRRRQRQRERHKAIGLNMFLYIYLLSSAKQHQMTKFKVLWRTCAHHG